MFSNISLPLQEPAVNYPITDSEMPFAEYIKQCQSLIAERRLNLGCGTNDAEKIISANSPFEYYPTTDKKAKYGALLIHGLLDCPFTFRDLATQLQAQGILSRAILLPGHGTKPDDLMAVTYHDWLQAVRYGVETLKKEVDYVYLVGFSTGAALAIYHAMQDANIAGIIALSPAIKIRTPVDMMANWYHLTNYLGKGRHWAYHTAEVDYVKYKSIPFNSVRQVTKLAESIREMTHDNPLKQPIYMILSREDETISSHNAIDFFLCQHHPESKMLLYTSLDHRYSDRRIETRKAVYPDLNIAHISHPSLGFSPSNPHYGQEGDYINASHNSRKYIYGAYNTIEINAFKLMSKINLVKYPRRVLTYNPDFNNMASNIARFITAGG
jgi:esterase/lipase